MHVSKGNSSNIKLLLISRRSAKLWPTLNQLSQIRFLPSVSLIIQGIICTCAGSLLLFSLCDDSLMNTRRIKKLRGFKTEFLSVCDSSRRASCCAYLLWFSALLWYIRSIRERPVGKHSPGPWRGPSAFGGPSAPSWPLHREGEPVVFGTADGNQTLPFISSRSRCCCKDERWRRALD